MGALRRCLVPLLAVVAAQVLVAAAPATAAPGDLATVAGSVTGASGTGNALSIAMAPRGIAVSGSTLYIADQDANAVRKVDLTTSTTTVVAGTGAPNNSGDGGQASSAGLNNPYDVDLDSSGNLYIASTSNNRIRKVTVSTGVISTVAGSSSGYSGDGGTATSAKINNPYGVAVAANGDFYIADTLNKVIRKVTAATGVISTFASTGLTRPYNIAFDSSGNVYVTDCGTNVNQILRFPAAGGTGTVVAGAGGVNAYSGDGGLATAARLACPAGIYIDASNTIYFSDSINNRIRQFTVGGTISTFAGSGTQGLSGDGGQASAAALDTPTDLTRDASGNFFFAQGALMTGANTTTTAVVREITSAGVISTVAGNAWKDYSGDGGSATSAQLGHPAGVAVDGSDNVYVADSVNNRIRKVTTGGVITTVAGTGFGGTSSATATCPTSTLGDGGAATSGNIYNPQGVAVGPAGQLFIADTGHCRIRMVSTSGVITTLAGTGVAGSANGAATTTATFNSPYGIFAASDGSVYVADQGSNKIRKISGGTVTTIAGTGTAGYSGDNGSATSATLNGPSDVRVDQAGDIYIADTGNNVVRKIHNGVITTIAGTGTAGTTGDGGLATAATLNAPAGLEVDTGGNLYIADTGNHVVRRVDRHGVIHNIAGKLGSGSWGGDGGAGAASGAYLFSPARMALDSTGSLYIASSGEMRVRKLVSQTAAATFWTSDATAGHTNSTYAWEFVVQTSAAIGRISVTVPSATNSSATGLYVVSAVNLPTTGTLSLTSGVLTYTLASAVTLPVGTHLYLSVNGFTNTASSGWYLSTLTTATSSGTTIDVSRSGAINFITPSSAVLVLPNASTTTTATTTTTVYVDPMLGGDVSVAAPITVQTNATYGYSLSVQGTALTGTNGTIAAASSGIATAVSSAAFGADRIGYTVTGVGGSGAGSVVSGLSGTYAGYTTAGETVLTATRPTSVTGDVIALTNRVKVDRLMPAGVYSGTLTYTVTPSY